ncbi:MAG: MFS transporter [Burkholderiales bacterium]
MIEALRHSQFRLLWCGSLFTYAGHWIHQVVFAWVAYELTGSGAVVGAVLGFRAIPILLLASLSGVAADRYSRRHLLMGASLVNVIGALLMGGLIATKGLQTWHLFVFITMVGSAHVFDRTTRYVSIQDLVPIGAVMNAVALNTIAFNLMRVLSPALAGYLLAWFSAEINFFIQAMLYAAAILTASLIRFPARARAERGGSIWQSLTEGMRYAVSDRTTRSVFLFSAVPFLFLIPIWNTLMPLYAKGEFNAGPEGLGWLFAAVGIGGLIGGFIAAALSRFDRLGSLQIASGIAFLVALVGIAFSPTLAIALPFVVLAGIGEMVTTAAGQTLMQLSAPASMRGRVLSLLQFNPALISIGSVAIGVGADLIGPRGITLAATGAALMAGVVMIVKAPDLFTLRASTLQSKAE